VKWRHVQGGAHDCAPERGLNLIEKEKGR